MSPIGRVVAQFDSRGKKRVQVIRPKDEEIHTVQSDAHLADIRNIMARYEETGMEQLDEADLIYKDVSEFTDLQDALLQAKEAEVDFMKLPSKVREIFDHDVAVWLDTAHDEDKRKILVDRGFLKAPDPEPKPGPPLNEVVPPVQKVEKVAEPTE